jgi:hypothetical protein
MIACSFGVIAKRFPDYSVFGLLGVVLAQGKCLYISESIRYAMHAHASCIAVDIQ